MRLSHTSRSLLSFCLLSFAVVRAVVITELPATKNYDFIIVGGGTAGNVIANRLTEDPSVNVLVIEGGPTDVGVAASQIPFIGATLTPNTPYDWNYTTVDQVGLEGRSIPYPRGHMLGGSSSVNYLIFNRGSQDDFDAYANITGDEGWSWNNLLPYFKKYEFWTQPADGHNITGQFDPTVHGFNGLLNVSLPGFPTPIDGRIVGAADELGGKFAFNIDTNSGNELGISYIQATVNHSVRSSSSTAYLAPQFLARPNLDVILNTQVSRVLQTGKINGALAFKSVEFRTNSSQLSTLVATKEVILCAGSIGSPHILMNSGIGNSTELSAFGITPLVELPDVGENLNDHAFSSNAWFVNTNETFEPFLRDPSVQQADLAEYLQTGQGFLVDTISSHIGFMRLEDDHPIFNTTEDPAAGPLTPHYELLFSNGMPIPGAPVTGNFLGIGTVVVATTSRGSVKLNSSDPFDHPLIDPALLASEFDKVAMREAVKAAQQFAAADAWSDYVIVNVNGLSVNSTDDEIDAFASARTGTIFHPAGTAAMSAIDAPNGVVDPDLRVKNTTNLRVVDASVFPFVPRSHPQGPVYVLAERAADIIKAAYNLTSLSS